MYNLDKSLEKLERWFEENPYNGYDPYDIKGHPITISLQKYSISRKASNIIFELFPRLSRKVLNVKSSTNHKGIGLVAHANLLRFKESKKPHYLSKSKRYLQYLKENKSENYSGYCWGYPFDWQSKIRIPAGTPSVVVSVIVGDAFLTYREITDSSEYDEVITGIAHFILNDLNTSIKKTGICFSYTPLDSFSVHNANMFASYFLIRTGLDFHREDWVARGTDALRFTLSEQQENGGIPYWSNDIKPPFIDNFHTGYVLRMLNRIDKLMPSIHLSTVIESGMEFFMTRLFRDDFPLRSLSSLYPIDIHTLNEVLLVYAELEEYRSRMEKYFNKSINYLLNSMQSSGGIFHYRHYRYFKVKIPFFRWSQAWTFLSLSFLKERGLG